MLKDVKEYYYKLLNQYLEIKADMADFDKACKDGFITEDQLKDAKEDFLRIEQNYNRVSFFMFLLTNQPKRPRGKRNRNKYNIDKEIKKMFKLQKADDESVLNENNILINLFRTELQKVKNQSKNKHE